MSKYFYDCEFLEGTQKSFLGQSKPTIDLISIGIVAEDGREYYAISKDFNLKEAWNRFDEKVNMNYKPTFGGGSDGHYNPKFIKEYWIRENVLKPIWVDLVREHNNKVNRLGLTISHKDKSKFNYKTFKYLLNAYGKTNKKIAQEVKNFCYFDKETKDGGGQFVGGSFIPNKYPNINLYGYYSAYDHVALCWLFGKMIDLPKGFPMYTIDLKQEMDRIAELESLCTNISFKDCLNDIKNHKEFPKQTNNHNALSDAKFNFELYKFLNE